MISDTWHDFNMVQDGQKQCTIERSSRDTCLGISFKKRFVKNDLND